MKKIFVDTNILLDLLFQRRGFFLDEKDYLTIVKVEI